MAYASEASYENMIAALGSYIKKINEQSNIMKTAAKDCVDNTHGDDNVKDNAAKLNDSLDKISKSTEKIAAVKKALEDELEELRRIRREATTD